ncbi:MAG TPA: alanine racemase [Candidatus Omnitrophota bacterium]|nr:alanine racemase [Candidatus Omnitrophota bacterium]
MVQKNPYIGYRPTWAEVNLDNLSFNLAQIRKRIPHSTRVMACVKADAYGHGLIPISLRLVAEGVDYLAVASIDEAIRLRQARISKPILVLGLILKQDIEPLFDYDIVPTVCTEDFARVLDVMAGARGRVARVHIKVDTGMGRIGVLSQDAFAFIQKIKRLKNIQIEGVFTHLASADVDRAFTNKQLRLFRGLVNRCEARGIHIPLVHAANSMGVVSYARSHFSMVRPGLILYGLYPAKGLSIHLKPVLSLKTRVIYKKCVHKGSGISYGHTYITPKNTSVITLPIGYGDGYPRNLSNCGPVLINDAAFTISGRVCMDQIMVDVGSRAVEVGDEVILIGSSATRRITAEQLAELSGTIPYEIVCGLGSRVPRIYTPAVARSEENRQFARYERKLPVRMLETSGWPDTFCYTHDISARGLQLVTERPLAPRMQVKLALEAQREPPVHTQGTVVWARQNSVGLYHAGVKLDKSDLSGMCAGASGGF